MSKKLFNSASAILDYGLDSVWCSRVNITYLVRGDFIPCFFHSTSQGSYIYVVFIAIHGSFREEGVCNKKYKNVAALPCA